MSPHKILFIVLLIIISSCNEEITEEISKKKSLPETNICSCGDLVLDELYQHFYITERTLPFTGICIENHKNGNLYQKKEFIKGKMNGEFLEYSANNKLIKKWNTG